MSRVFKVDYIPDPDRGRPLWNAKIFIGVANQDPTIPSNQIQLTGDIGFPVGQSIPVPQPVRTNAGGITVYNNSPLDLNAPGQEYAIQIFDRNDNLIYNFPQVDGVVAMNTTSQEEVTGLIVHPDVGIATPGQTVDAGVTAFRAVLNGSSRLFTTDRPVVNSGLLNSIVINQEYGTGTADVDGDVYQLRDYTTQTQEEITGVDYVNVTQDQVDAGFDLFPLIGQGIRVAGVGLWVVPSVTADGSPMPNPANLDAVPTAGGLVSINGASDSVQLTRLAISAGAVDTFSSTDFPVNSIVKSNFYYSDTVNNLNPIYGLNYINRGQGWPVVADGFLNHSDSSGNFLELIHDGEVTTDQIGCNEYLDDCAPNIQAAVNDSNVYITKLSSDLMFDTQVELTSNNRIQGNGVFKIITDGVSVKVPFVTADHCENDFSVFAGDIHIWDVVWDNTLDLGDFRSFVDNLMWHCANVRGVSVRRCKATNGGLWYMTHARRYWGTYNADLANNTDPNIDPAETAGFSSTGGDLNMFFWFTDNEATTKISQTVIGKKHLVQAFRFEFCEWGNISRNQCTRAAISGWGGDANIDKGGNLQFYRRCRHVMVSQNINLEVNALYVINGFMCGFVNNNVQRGIDLGIDLEGSFYCNVIGNNIYNSGNGNLGIFYASVGNLYSGNVCVQDGGGANIRDEFNIFDRWGPNDGREMYRNAGAGFTNQIYADTTRVEGNEFWYTGPEDYGFVNITEASESSYNNNRHFDVVIEGYGAVNNGRFRGLGNEFTATKDLKSNIVKLGQGGTLIPNDTILDSTVFYINATQTGSACIELYQQGNENFYHYIRNTKVYGDDSCITNFVSGVNESVNAGRFHYAFIEDSKLPNGVNLFEDQSVRGAAWLLNVDNNKRHSGEPAITVTSGQQPVSNAVGYMKHTKLPLSDIESANYEGVIFEGDGFRPLSTAQWQTATFYNLYSICFNSSGEIYYATSSGTSSVEPTGTGITDGSLVWVRLPAGFFDRRNWRKYGVLADF